MDGERSIKWSVAWVFFALLILVVGALFLLGAVVVVKEAYAVRTSSAWFSAEGLVTQTEIYAYKAKRTVGKSKRTVEYTATEPVIEYTYQVNGVSYRNNRLNFSGTNRGSYEHPDYLVMYMNAVLERYADDAERYERDFAQLQAENPGMQMVIMNDPEDADIKKMVEYPIGSAVTVFYDPKDPSNSLLEKASNNGIGITILAIVGCLIFGLGSVAGAVAMFSMGFPEVAQAARREVILIALALAIGVSFLISQASERRARAYDGTAVTKHNTVPLVTAEGTALAKLKKESAAYYERGLDLYNKQAYTEAIGEFTRAIDINPDYLDAYWNRGFAYESKGEYERALADYAEGLRINPNQAELYYNRGNVYKGLKDYDKAIEQFSQAIRIYPDYLNAYWGRGFAHESKGEYEPALADYTEGLRINPNQAELYYNRGNVYEDMDDYARAIEQFSEYLKIEADDADAYQRRGDCYRMSGEYDKAIADQDHAIGLDARSPHAYGSRGMAYYRKGNHEKAVSDLTEAIRLKPDYVWAYQSRATVYSAQGKNDLAALDTQAANRLLNAR